MHSHLSFYNTLLFFLICTEYSLNINWFVKLAKLYFRSSTAAMGRNMLAPLLFLNFILYIVVIGFASWCLNHFINGQAYKGGVTGNGATFYFLIFAILAGVVGAASKFAGVSHVHAWRSDSLGAAAASAIIAWAITALAFGLACKEIHVGGYRGWRLKALEAFIIILCFTQLLYVLLLHAGMVSSKHGPTYG